MWGSGWCLGKGGRRSQHALRATRADSRWTPRPRRSLASKAAAGQGRPCLAKGRPVCSAPHPQPCPACRFVLGSVLSEGRCSLSLGRALQEAGDGCRVAVPSLRTRALPPLQPCSAEARLRRLLLRAAAVGQCYPAEVGVVSLPMLPWLCPMPPCTLLPSAAAAGFSGAAVLPGQTHLSVLRGAERSCCSLQLVFVAAEWSHWMGCASRGCFTSVQQAQGWRGKLGKKEGLGSNCALVGLGYY